MTTTGAQVADATGEGCMQASAISESECWSLLASAPMGRLSAWVGDWPSIIPVQFYLDDGSIAVCLGPHTLDARSLDGAKVGFAVDGVESSSTSWWTVQVHGLGRTIPPDPSDPWRDCGQPDGGRVLLIDQPTVSGTRLVMCSFKSTLNCLLAMGR